MGWRSSCGDRVWWGVLVGLLGGVVPAAAQCALCRSAVETGNPVFAEVLRSGILVLLLAPYVLGLCLVVVLWRAWRRRYRSVGGVSRREQRVGLPIGGGGCNQGG